MPLQEAIWIDESLPIEESIRIMQNEHRGCVLIKNSQSSFIGILTERDVMHKYLLAKKPKTDPISEIMTKDVSQVNVTTSVSEAVDLFVKNQFRHLPVTDDEKVIGVLSVRGLVDFLAENLPEEVFEFTARS